MTFNIRQSVFDRDGVPREKVARQYQDQLIQLSEQSPEGQTLREEQIEGGWTNLMLDFGLNYIGKTPPKMSSYDLREILFDLFPRKVSASEKEAPEIIRELQLFWTFLQREFHLENAAACLKVLNEKKAARELKAEMSNPANFGIAKSFVMMGMERGFDMSTQEGINEWMLIYNAELAAGRGPRIPLPGEQDANAKQVYSQLSSMLGAGSRRRNRKKK